MTGWSLHLYCLGALELWNTKQHFVVVVPQNLFFHKHLPDSFSVNTVHLFVASFSWALWKSKKRIACCEKIQYAFINTCIINDMQSTCNNVCVALLVCFSAHAVYNMNICTQHRVQLMQVNLVLLKMNSMTSCKKLERCRLWACVVFYYSSRSSGFLVSTPLDVVQSSCFESLEEEVVIPMVNPASVVTISLWEKLKMPQVVHTAVVLERCHCLQQMVATVQRHMSLTHDKYRVLHAFIQSSLRCSECIHFQYEWSKGDSVILIKNQIRYSVF